MHKIGDGVVCFLSCSVKLCYSGYIASSEKVEDILQFLNVVVVLTCV
jgi:hypothetical protein